jgi:hypothetical protein
MSRAGLIDDTEGATEAQGHVTWVKGTHTVKSGLNISKMGFNVFRPEYPSGQYVYGAGYTQGPNPSAASSAAGYGFATFLLGAPTSGQVTGHFIWQIPFGKGRRWANTGWLADVVGRWQLSGIGVFSTGRPLVITGITASNGVSTGLGAYAKLLGDTRMLRWVVALPVYALAGPAAFGA